MAWRKERIRAPDLEERLKPKLAIPRRIRRQPWTDSRGRCVSYYLDVINESEGTTVDGVEVCLTEIDPPDLRWLPVPLHIKHDNKQPYEREFSLNPLDKKQIDLVSMVQGAPAIDIISTIGGDGVKVDPGRYLMTVTASGRDVSSVSRTFEVWVDHEHYLQAEAP